MTTLALMALTAGCVRIPAGTDAIRASDVADAEPLFAAAPPDASLGFAPSPGVRRAFTQPELRRIALRLGLDGDPGPLCVERAVAPLSREQILAAMRRALPEASIELVDWSRHGTPDGDLEFPAAGLQSSGLWHGSVRYGGTRRFAVWARATVRVRRTQVVSVEPLAAAKPVRAEQVRLETVEGPPGAVGRAASVEEVVGRLPRRTIAKGAVVKAAMLTDAPEVARGEVVTVEVRRGAARLELEARAERDGRRGERIPVVNPATKRRFMARVTGAGRASASEENQP